MFINKFIKNIHQFYKLTEFNTHDPGNLPQAPTIDEKYSYIKRDHKTIVLFSIISFTAIQISMFNFLTNNTLMWPLFGYFILTIIYFLVSLLVNIFSKNFDIIAHKNLVEKWRDLLHDSVDIFLPTAGEPIEVLQNTWDGIKKLSKRYKGEINIYCLDDADRNEVRILAIEYGFHYEVRPNRGWFKKSGNLRHGFEISHGEYIVVFDADFRPRADFLHELLPYFHENKSIGLVQSPQYFDVHPNQNWLQRGAGAVQELFYRISQVSRQNHEASICVGSNAIYRRTALTDIGGPALIEHSEDVHTGFNMKMRGWKLQYIPIILAKGLCPADMKAFFKQQYRWCLGSMTLLSSGKFWRTRITLMGRLSYFSGFLYYIHTATSSFFVPVVPLALILLYPEQVNLKNYLFILPSLIFVQFIYPLWHRATYGIEAWSTRSVYGWAHMFAIFDAITKKPMHWQPTGSKIEKDFRYITFRIFQIIFNFIPAILWIYLSAEQVFFKDNIIFLPLFLGGIYYYLMTAKVTFYIAESISIANRELPNYFWGTRPAGRFLVFTLIVINCMVFSLISKDNHTPSPEKKALPLKTLNNNQVQGTSTKNNQLVEGYYTELAVKDDSLTNIVDRIMNTYSAESGDLLTLRERKSIKTYFIEKLSKESLKVGTEIKISRQEMKSIISKIRS